MASKINSAACPYCRGTSSVQGNDCTGRTRPYNCNICDGAGIIYADDEDCVANVVDLLAKAMTEATNTKEEIEWYNTEGRRLRGDARADGAIQQYRMSLRTSRRTGIACTTCLDALGFYG